MKHFGGQFDNLDELEKRGFIGFQTIAQLRASGCAEVCKQPGIYFVLRLSQQAPSFLPISTGGHFKGDPTADVQMLSERWVAESKLVYIGKAGSLLGNGKRTLRKRVREFVRFGAGDKVAHWGGRYTWQIHDASDLVVCWKPVEDEEPREVEQRLIEEFRNQYQKRPFANINA